MMDRSSYIFSSGLLFLSLLVYKVDSGPHVCSDRLQNHFATKLTEFPTNPNDDEINFLQYGDKCNINIQVIFEKQLFRTFTTLTSEGEWTNEYIIIELDEIWNQYRRNTVDGSLGDRICNPRRLLGCHPTLKQCVCRPDFQLEAPHARDSYRGITVHSESVETVNPAKDKVETVIACRATGNCLWSAPWFGFCHIGCVKDHYCIGIDSSDPMDTNELCIPCKPFSGKGLEECEAEGARANLGRRKVHVHADDNNAGRLTQHKILPTIMNLVLLVLSTIIGMDWN